MATSSSNVFCAYWLAAGRELGFRVSSPFQVALRNGHSFVAPVLLPDFGAKNGMLLFPHYEQVKPYANAVVQAGFGYSALHEPATPEPDIESLVEVLKDWGWSGVASLAPAWLNET